MEHENFPRTAALTWAHDPLALVYARDQYAKKGHAVFGMYASTIYSFRQLPECIAEMIRIRGQIIARVNMLLKLENDADRLRTASQLETSATHLEWLSHRSELDLKTREDTLSIAKTAVDTAILKSKEEPVGGHTRALAFLLRAFILMNEGRTQMADKLLALALERAPAIKDLNQKRRVYRKLAYLFLKRRSFLTALHSAIASLKVPREKSRGQEP